MYLRKDLLADLHTHTVGSIHAYSTVDDILRRCDLPYIAITDHVQKFGDKTFQNNIDGYINDQVRLFVSEGRLIAGAELDIDVDLRDTIVNTDSMQLRLLSYHNNNPEFSAEKYIRLLEELKINILAHPWRYGIRTEKGKKEWDEVVTYCAEHDIIIEINERSIKNLDTKLLQALNCTLSIGSDAHYAPLVGKVDKALDYINTYLSNKSVVNFDKGWLSDVRNNKFVITPTDPDAIPLSWGEYKNT